MMQNNAPPSILVGGDDRILQISPRAGRYLMQEEGEPTSSVLAQLREELRAGLRAALHKARKLSRPQRTETVSVRLEGRDQPVTMDVRPVEDAGDHGRVLVIFDEGGVESGREEMRVANEELQSANEELRAMMEELEASREELQGVNEELHALNQENRQRVQELAGLTSDLQNFLAATDIPTLFLDRELRIMRFTPGVQGLVNIRPEDRGRPLSDLTSHLVESKIVDDARLVLATLTPSEREIEDERGKVYLTRLLPYRTTTNSIEGVVITFVDITRRKQAERELRQSQNVLAHELAAMRRVHQMMVHSLASAGLKATLKEVLQAAIDIQEAEFGTVQLVRDDGALEIVAQQGFSPRFLETFARITADDPSTCGRALRRRERVVVRDIESEESYAGFKEIAAAAGYRAVQSTPMISRSGAIVGILSTYFREPRVLQRRQGQWLDVLAQHAADLIDRIRWEVELRRLNETLEERVDERTRDARMLAATLTRAEQQERRRISQLLHDDLQQLLYGIQTRLALARNRSESDGSEQLIEQVDLSLALLGEAVTRTRRLTVDLSPPILEGEGLAEAIQWLQSRMRESYDLDVVVHANEAAEGLSIELRILVFQAVRELLFNVAKHSGTTSALVEINDADEGVEVVVLDEGKGFDVAGLEETEPGSRGYGLFSVRERVRLHGGSMDTVSGPGRGTRVRIYVPRWDHS